MNRLGNSLGKNSGNIFSTIYDKGKKAFFLKKIHIIVHTFLAITQNWVANTI